MALQLGLLRPSSLCAALIVFEDADIEKAVEWTMFGIFWTVGQVCADAIQLSRYLGMQCGQTKQGDSWSQ